MQVKGRIFKDGKWWVVTIPALQADTQGETKKEALDMAEDWLRTMLDDPEFAVKATAKDEELTLTFSDVKPVLALMIERSRSVAGYTLRQVAEAIGQKNVNGVHQYETGKHEPSLTKLQELAAAMGFDVQIGLVRKTKTA